MLYATIHHPSIYDLEIDRSHNNDTYFSCVINILRDACSNCIIIVDKNGEVIKRMKRYIDSWPIEFRKQAKELLRLLEKKNRIIRTRQMSTDNSIDDCSIFRTITNGINDAVIVMRECTEYIKGIEGEVIEVEKYQLSNFLDKKRRISFVISDGSRTHQQLNDLVFRPIFEYCDSIKIIDKVIGSCINMHPGNLSENYKAGLNFLANCISTSSRNPESLSIELYTSLSLPKPIHALAPEDKTNIRSTIYNIEEFILQINKKNNLNIKCFFKYDKTSFVHDRYIITNQVGLYIGRGFDLVDEHLNVRNNTIGLLETYNSIETTIRTLLDLKSVV